MTLKDQIEATRKRLAEAAEERRQKLKSGSMQPKNEKLKLPKPHANVPKQPRKPRAKGK